MKNLLPVTYFKILKTRRLLLCPAWSLGLARGRDWGLAPSLRVKWQVKRIPCRFGLGEEVGINYARRKVSGAGVFALSSKNFGWCRASVCGKGLVCALTTERKENVTFNQSKSKINVKCPYRNCST